MMCQCSECEFVAFRSMFHLAQVHVDGRVAKAVPPMSPNVVVVDDLLFFVVIFCFFVSPLSSCVFVIRSWDWFSMYASRGIGLTTSFVHSYYYCYYVSRALL